MKLVMLIAAAVFFTACSQKSTSNEVPKPEVRTQCSTEKPKFQFAQLTDTHVGNKNQDLLDQAIDRLNAMGPDFVVNTGDISDHTVRDTQIGIQELTEYMIRMQALSPKLYTVPGNHDVGYREGQPSEGSWSNYDDNVAAYTSIVGPLDQEFVFGGFQFILIDNNPLASKGGAHITDDQMEWIESLLKKGLPTILMGHVQLLYMGTGEPWGESATKLVSMIEKYPNALGFLNGHQHFETLKFRKERAYITAPDLKVIGHNDVYFYKVFEHKIEVCSHDLETGASFKIASWQY